MDKIKSVGWTFAGIAMSVGTLLVIILFIKGGAWLTSTYLDLFNAVSYFMWVPILVFLCAAIFPGARFFAGMGIAYAAMVWAAIFWLICLTITYTYWGAIGTLVGLFFAGVGIYITAPLAVALDGSWVAAIYLLLNLAVIWGFRALGYWIATKHKEKAVEVSLSA